jgi:hypothetical protein
MVGGRGEKAPERALLAIIRLTLRLAGGFCAHKTGPMADIAPRTERPSLFKETAGSIKTLRRSYKNKPPYPDAATFFKELRGESDGASIIFAASLLDDALT